LSQSVNALVLSTEVLDQLRQVHNHQLTPRV
jgi:hypothetical protein